MILLVKYQRTRAILPDQYCVCQQFLLQETSQVSYQFDGRFHAEMVDPKQGSNASESEGERFLDRGRVDEGSENSSATQGREN
jgi:hypothetical protein